MVQLVMHLPNKCEVLSSNCQSHQKEKNIFIEIKPTGQSVKGLRYNVFLLGERQQTMSTYLPSGHVQNL
jgi:hypothetical protein